MISGRCAADCATLMPRRGHKDAGPGGDDGLEFDDL
jgi:hypothetical protein